MNAHPRTDATAAIDESGVVLAQPRLWLRTEAAVLLAAALVGFAKTGQSWWLVALLLLAPDLLMIGYARSSKLGAVLYNLAHATPLPAALAAFGWWQDHRLALAAGFVWLAHIGMDRLLGYGLKYDDHFQHTHLGLIGKRGHAQKSAG